MLDSIPNSVLESLNATDRVRGLTHDLYRYPARFSPLFVRAAIEAFTTPGGLVLDPFVGGGTTAVESLACGRRVIAADINRLSVFVTRAKTTPLTGSQVVALTEWSEGLAQVTSRLWLTSTGKNSGTNLPWRIRKSLLLGLDTLSSLRDKSVRRVARATLLRAGQWALDGRREIPNRQKFLVKHREISIQMADGAFELGTLAAAAFNTRSYVKNRRVLWSAAADLPNVIGGAEADRPDLILTSPPYHGVHILYHRWQVGGRRETNAPYWISGTKDGRPASYYTFGARARKSDQERPAYFRHALASFASLARMCTPNTLVAQLVGFAHPESQLPRYMAMLDDAGFTAVDVRDTQGGVNVTRTVPNRKWYLDALGRNTESSKEYLLLHRRHRL